MSDERLKTLHDAMRIERAYIRRANSDIAEAVKMSDHDPWKWMQKRVKANQERQVHERQLVVLEQEWRSLGGDTSERNPGAGTYSFIGSNS